MKPIRKRLFILSIIAAVLFTGCSQGNGKQSDGPVDGENTAEYVENEDNIEESNSESEYIPVYLNDNRELVYAAEAEDGIFTGKVAAESSAEGYKGTGYVKGFEDEEDSCTVKITVKEDGMYDLNFVSASLGGYKENYVYVDGENLGVVSVESSEFSDSELEHIYLSAGDHEVNVKKILGLDFA